jgi:hypothetical protein
LNPKELAQYAVLLLPNAAALSAEQVAAVRQFVEQGGGLVATCESSLCDESGSPRADFALAELFGVSYRGRPQSPAHREKLDENFAVAIDEDYWRQRTGVATLTWRDHALLQDERLRQLVPSSSVIFRGPLVRVTDPKDSSEAALLMAPAGAAGPPLVAGIARSFGNGKVVYLAAAIDAALWSYAYPYQRRLLARAIAWAANRPAPLSVRAPMCVQATYFEQPHERKRRLIIHLFNGINTAADHGLPASEVPLREESVAIHGIEVSFHGYRPRACRCEPDGQELPLIEDGGRIVVRVPPLEDHMLVVADL